MEFIDEENNTFTDRFSRESSASQCFYMFEGRHASRDPVRLDHLAASKFISIERNINSLPHLVLPNDLYHTLLSVALVQQNTAALAVIIGSWPYPVFSLNKRNENNKSELNSIHVTHVKPDTPEMVASVDMKQKFQMSLTVLHSFLESLRTRALNNIKVLDLRGYPLGNMGIRYLSCQGLLAHSERQRNEILRTVSSAVVERRISAEEASVFGDLSDLHNSIPDKSYIVILDCFVSCESSFQNLCKALTISQFDTCPIKMMVDKVRLSYGYDVGANLLLELIGRKTKPTLNGFGVEKLFAHHLEHVLPSLYSYGETLTSLDFSGNSIDFSLDFRLTNLTIEFFKSLTNLKRLDLSFCKLKRQLRKLLPNLHCGLEYLNMNSCELSDSDMIYLSSSCHHCDTLQELSLSTNNLSTSTSSLCCLLKKCRNSLKMLNLQDCTLQSSQSERIFIHLQSLQCIEWINLTKNAILRQSLINYAPMLKNHPTLKMLWLPYPASDFTSPTPGNLQSEENIVSLNEWRNDFETLMNDLLETRPNRSLCVKCAYMVGFNYLNVQV